MNSATQINNCPFACRKWERLQCSSILFLYPSPLQAKVFEWFKVSWEIEKVKNYPSQTKIAMTRFLSTILATESQTSQTNHHGAHDFIHRLEGITNLQEYSVEPQELSFVSVISSSVLQGITNLQVYLVEP